MKLNLFDDCENKRFKNSKALKLFKCKLYYISYGRNAWHSTWINRYHDGSIHTSLQSAKNFVEGKRVQGSVFRISEIPGIVYQSDKGFLIVTEINTDEVLKGFKFINLEEGFYSNKPIVSFGGGVNDKFLDIDEVFSPFSENWENRSNYKNSILVLWSDDNEVKFKKYSKTNSFIYKSHSIGKDYNFYWSDSELLKADKYCNRIVRNFKKYDANDTKDFHIYQYLVSKRKITRKAKDLQKVSSMFRNNPKLRETLLRKNII